MKARSADTGHILDTQRVGGRLSIRAVSADAGAVALMKPLPPGTSAWTPRSRAFTNIVVAHPQSGVAPERFHLAGNFEPEGFSSDDSMLYLIRYLPATAPVAYRVSRLELGDGDVYPVYGRAKSPVETMYGSRLMQVPAPGGARLYTLYASQPPEYAKGYDRWQAGAGREVAFVHTLSLENGWATCVGLPKSLWGAVRETTGSALLASMTWS